MAVLPPNPELEFSFPIDVTQVAALGRDYALTAKPDERKRVATRLDLLELTALTAQLHVVPGAGGVVQVTGRLAADVIQECVVTLVPLKASVTEEFTRTFARQVPKTFVEEIDVEITDDPPEALHGDVLDLAEVVVEQLALLIDPYPRAPGAVFNPQVASPPEAPKAAVSPFAILAKLKTKS
jgi:uncharacterized metal-binding protein YceD (DUF177 family)